jgi:zinc transporter 1/2/3
MLNNTKKYTLFLIFHTCNPRTQPCDKGLALGVRIAAISWPARSPQHWLMAMAYGRTTPLGQAIGITTHTLYSPNSKAGLLVVGIMNAISSEFLVFASLVELMSEDFLGD